MDLHTAGFGGVRLASALARMRYVWARQEATRSMAFRLAHDRCLAQGANVGLLGGA